MIVTAAAIKVVAPGISEHPVASLATIEIVATIAAAYPVIVVAPVQAVIARHAKQLVPPVVALKVVGFIGAVKRVVSAENFDLVS